MLKKIFFLFGFFFMVEVRAESLKCKHQGDRMKCLNKEGKEVSVINPNHNGASTLTGEIEHLHSDGKLQRWQRFENGKLEEAKFYYLNGTLQRHEVLRAGKKHGTSLEYSEKGKLVSRTQWNDDKKEGPYIEYRPYDYELSRSGTKKNFQDHGFTRIQIKGGRENISCFQDGRETEDWSLCDPKFKNQKRQALKYHENGNMLRKIDYVNGDKIGQELWYHSNGKVSREGQNRNNQPVGIWVWNNADGVKSKAIEYKSKDHFTENKYYTSGQLEESTEMKDGKVKSRSKFYMNGKKKSEFIQEQPTIASYVDYDDQERVVESGKLVQGPQQGYRLSFVDRMEKDGIVQFFNYADKIKSECEMKLGVRSGWCKEYELESNQLRAERRYEKGKMREEKIYIGGQLQSKKEFFEDGSEKK